MIGMQASETASRQPTLVGGDGWDGASTRLYGPVAALNLQGPSLYPAQRLLTSLP